jgi:hypothetical protein
MNDPRPAADDVRLSTADLANAGDLAKERAAEQGAPKSIVTPPPVSDRQVRETKRAELADSAARTTHADEDHPTPLFASNETEDFRHRWSDIQTGFVDEPRQAVERADALVAAAIKRLAEIFAEERANLERQWSRGGDVSTEDLRVALRRYRGFFDRLLSV